MVSRRHKQSLLRELVANIQPAGDAMEFQLTGLDVLEVRCPPSWRSSELLQWLSILSDTSRDVAIFHVASNAAVPNLSRQIQDAIESHKTVIVQGRVDMDFWQAGSRERWQVLGTTTDGWALPARGNQARGRVWTNDPVLTAVIEHNQSFLSSDLAA